MHDDRSSGGHAWPPNKVIMGDESDNKAREKQEPNLWTGYAVDVRLLAERRKVVRTLCLVGIGVAAMLLMTSFPVKQGMPLYIDIFVAALVGFGFAAGAGLAHKDQANLAAFTAGVVLTCSACLGDIAQGAYTDKMWVSLCGIVIAGLGLDLRLLWGAYFTMLAALIAVPVSLPGHPLGPQANPTRVIDMIVVVTALTLLLMLHVRSVLLSEHRTFLTTRALDEQRLRAEEAARHAARAARGAEIANNSKSMFLANVSHELRTPLNAIIGYSELMIEEAEEIDFHDFDQDLDRVRESAHSLLAMVDDVLDLSGLEAGNIELDLTSVEIKPLLAELAATVEPLLEANNNTLELDVADDVVSIQSDVTRLRQVLLNLLSNACKFTFDGKIWVRASTTHWRHEPAIKLVVQDTGVGMGEESVVRVFESFALASVTDKKRHGSGLGLPLSKKICELLGGEIDLSSAVDEGSTFVVYLPVVFPDNL